MNDAITLITDEKEDLQTLISAAKCFWILCCRDCEKKSVNKSLL